MSTSNLRNNVWLEERTQKLWNEYYKDASRGYPIKVKFGPRARYRFGSIYSCKQECHILVNRLFIHPEVPDYVVDATIAHELAHYVHGYGSGLRKLHSHPHRGGVVDKEMEKRGCLILEDQASVWRKENWQRIYATYAADSLKKSKNREDQLKETWEEFLHNKGARSQDDLKNRLASLSMRLGIQEPGFQIDWLHASLRRNGLSYRYVREEYVRLHGVLSSKQVPQYVIDYEISYWLIARVTGDKWDNIENHLKNAGLWKEAEAAILWRRKVWPNFYRKYHPLLQK